MISHRDGPNLLVRAVWWLLIGWWASGIAVAIAWFALITIIGIPLGIWLINRLPSVLTLRPRTKTWTLGEDANGRKVITEAGRRQAAWYWRGHWFVLVGWWASAIWMGLAWLIQLTIVGIPIALLMFNRTPFVASLYHY
ncbi:MAG: YccF domain-containing protein [Chloroflexi bacterium]|nr:YccF domain-containing protein [Chloroflexota bacterium]